MAWVLSAAVPACLGESCSMEASPAEDCCSGHGCCEGSADDCGSTSQAGPVDGCCGSLAEPVATTPASAPPLSPPVLVSCAASLALPASRPLLQADLLRDPAPPPDDGLYTLHSSFLI